MAWSSAVGSVLQHNINARVAIDLEDKVVIVFNGLVNSIIVLQATCHENQYSERKKKKENTNTESLI